MNSTFLLKRVSGSMYLVFLTPIPHSVQTFQVVLLGRIRTPADQPVCFRVKAVAWYRQNVQVFSCSWQLHVLLKLLCTQYVLHEALFMLWIFRNRYWGLSFFKKKRKKVIAGHCCSWSQVPIKVWTQVLWATSFSRHALSG